MRSFHAAEFPGDEHARGFAVAKIGQSREKHFGQVFTPPELVQDILDIAGYCEEPSILEKHVIDNSCGDGAFLGEVVQRYCKAFLKGSDDRLVLSQHLQTYVHGIEVDDEAYAACCARLERLEAEWALPSIAWDIRHADALGVVDFDGRMDFVVGNPPYVRVHNLAENFDRVKQFRFSNGGMTDLYLVFYEIGLRMLSEFGRLCYIAPSSWFNSVAGHCMREYLWSRHCLRAIVDLGHFQPFEATTYTAIVLLSKSDEGRSFSYGTYEGFRNVRHICELQYADAFLGDALFLGDKKTLHRIRRVIQTHPPQRVQVKNGFATLADDVFIADSFPFKEYVIPTLKASTGKWRKAFFPYYVTGKPIAREELFAHESISVYMLAHREQLLKGRSETECPDWYLYGRTQALRDVAIEKYAINTCIRDVRSIKFSRVPKGSGVYSGLYIVTSVEESVLRDALLNEDFIDYISSLKKYKSGGYYTFSSHDVEHYLNVVLDEKLSATEPQERQLDLFTELES